jgi:hypothetical protein
MSRLRVVMRWEWEEAHASWPVVGNRGTVHLADAMTGKKKAFCLDAVPHETMRKSNIIIIYGTYGFTLPYYLYEKIDR